MKFPRLSIVTFVAVVNIFAPAFTQIANAGEVSLRLWGGGGDLAMENAHKELESENAFMANNSWVGFIDWVDRYDGLGLGSEVSYSFNERARLVLSVELHNSEAEGEFFGIGAKSGQHVYRGNYYTTLGAELGGTYFLYTIGDALRFGLTVRVGVHTLADAEEEGFEGGPLNFYNWHRHLSGVAPGGLLGAEVELRAWRGFGAFVLAGYRVLSFDKYRFDFEDSNGVRTEGVYKTSTGGFRSLDFSGPEFRAGLSAVLGGRSPGAARAGAVSDRAEGGAEAVSYGFKAGLNISDVIGQDSGSTDVGFNFVGGGFVTVPFTKCLAIHPEVLFSTLGVTSTDTPPFPAQPTEITLSVDYIMLPILLRFTPPLAGPHLSLGPYFAFNVHDDLDFAGRGVDGSIKPSDLGMVFNIGTEIPMSGKGKFTFDIRYALGLTSFAYEDSPSRGSVDVQHSVVSLLFGYAFQ